MMLSESVANKVSDEVPKKTNSKMTVNEWMKMFHDVYENVDSKRSPLEMWVAATSYFSSVGEAIRCMDFTGLMHAASHAFCWMCSFVLACNRAKGTVFELKELFSDLVANKYPLVCKHCRQKYCQCNPKLMDKTKNKAAQYRLLLKERANLGDAPNTYDMSQWLDIFNDIYGQHIHMLTLESIGFHFLEEAGEELTAIRGLVQLENVLKENIDGIDAAFLANLTTFEGVVNLLDNYGGQEPEPHKRNPDAIKARLVRAKVDMYTEFADTFSWFCSILNKIISIASNCKDAECIFIQNAFHDKLLQEYLPDGKLSCPACRKCPCECVFYGCPWGGAFNVA